MTSEEPTITSGIDWEEPYFPALEVIVGNGDGLRTVLITDLLPES